jgi:ribosomal-protein-alanine N-acetyltransferase
VGTYWIAPSFENGKRVITAEAQRIGKPYWRKGYTKEARNLVYDYVFFDLEVEEVHAQAWKGNLILATLWKTRVFNSLRPLKRYFQSVKNGCLSTTIGLQKKIGRKDVCTLNRNVIKKEAWFLYRDTFS